MERKCGHKITTIIGTCHGIYQKNDGYTSGPVAIVELLNGRVEEWDASDVVFECASENKEAAPSASTNTGSPKLPSSTEVWNHVCEYSPALRTVEQIAADRRVAKLVYEFIYRQLRAGA